MARRPAQQDHRLEVLRLALGYESQSAFAAAIGQTFTSYQRHITKSASSRPLSGAPLRLIELLELLAREVGPERAREWLESSARVSKVPAPPI